MDRRTFLTLGVGGLGALAGCSSLRGGTPTSTPSPSTNTQAPTSSQSQTRTETQTEPPQDDARTIYVGPNGSDGNDGSEQSPVNRIQEALERAQPGDTIYVKPGQYFESPQTKRPGEPGNPITITGPADAVVSGEKGGQYADGFVIRHSHIHLTGLTLDGLQDPDNPDDPSSYMLRGVMTLPANHEYLTDLVIKPHAIGNTRTLMVKLTFVENVEVGEFKVTGPAGLRYKLDDIVGHVGEIVYVGSSPLQSPNAIEKKGELVGLDKTNNVHIHHIDNSEGHHHSELVNTKLGTHDILIEYCTDGGGSQNTETWPSASVRLQSYDATLRWCDLRNGKGKGVGIGSRIATQRQAEKSEGELTEAERLGGTRHSIYGNSVTGFDEGYTKGFYQGAFRFPQRDNGQTPEGQRVFCGNEYDGPTDGDPGKPCSDDVPEGDGIGHLGGDSPWR